MWVAVMVALPLLLGGEGEKKTGTPYTLDAKETRLEVHVYKAGLLSGLGHEHLIRSEGFEGEIRYDSGDVTKSFVRVEVPTGKLIVADEHVSESDRKKILANMREHVLKVEKHPKIVFVSKKFEATKKGAKVAGELTMCGVTRPVAVELTIERRIGGIRMTGAFDVKQTAFGITPYRAALGTIGVADRVTFDVDIAGRLAAKK